MRRHFIAASVIRGWENPKRGESPQSHRRKLSWGSSVPFPLWFGAYHLVTPPPSPCWPQNLENKRFRFLLCARSLSFKELHAKSREHGTCGWQRWLAVPFRNDRCGLCGHSGRGGPRAAPPAVRLSKIEDYLADNLCYFMLSEW